MNQMLVFALIFMPQFVFSKTVGEVLDVTKQNLKGHEALYNQGWFVVTSSKEAIEISANDSMSASQAMDLALKDIEKQKSELSEKVKKLRESTKQDAEEFNQSGSQRTKNIFSDTARLSARQWNFSKEMYSKAYSNFTLGYIEFSKRTQNDWEELNKANSNFVKRTKDPFNDQEMKLIMGDVFKDSQSKSEEGIWSKALTEAGDEFNQSYEESGKEGNSISGLATVMWGYAKSFYYGLVAPSGKTIVKGAKNAGPYLIGGTIAAVKVTGDVVYTTGLNIYYASKIGYKVISPTLEGGFLGSVALVSSISTPVVYAGGMTLGSLNQVAVTTATPAVGTGQFALATTGEAAKHSAIMVFDLAKGTGKALIYESKGMVVLGYNMLTAIPAQALLGVANGVVFLAYDGPHLVLVSLRGEIDGVPANQIPVGTVIDAKALEKKGMKIEKLTDDPTIIQKVLEAAPQDMSKGNSL